MSRIKLPPPIRRAQLVWAHPQLDKFGIALGIYLLTRCGDNGYADLSHERIAADLKISDSTITRATRQLEKIGLFRTSQLSDNKGNRFHMRYGEAEIMTALEHYTATIKELRNSGEDDQFEPCSAPTEQAGAGPTEQTSEVAPSTRADQELGPVSESGPGGVFQSRPDERPVSQSGQPAQADGHKQDSKQEECMHAGSHTSSDAVGDAPPGGAMDPPEEGDAGQQQDGGARAAETTLADHSPLNGSTHLALKKLREYSVATGKTVSDEWLLQRLIKLATEHGSEKTLMGIDDAHRKAVLDGEEVSSPWKMLESFVSNADPNKRKPKRKAGTTNGSGSVLRGKSLDEGLDIFIKRNPDDNFYTKAREQLHQGVVEGDEYKKFKAMHERANR